jgi:hypothetical protein
MRELGEACAARDQYLEMWEHGSDSNGGKKMNVLQVYYVPNKGPIPVSFYHPLNITSREVLCCYT